MNRFLCIMGLALGLLQGNCAMPAATDTHPSADTTLASPKESPSNQRGPWDAERLKAAEALMITPARSDLDRQRQALASAYIQWGDALFKDLGLPALTDKTGAPGAFQIPLAASAEEQDPSTTTGPAAAWSSPPLWYWNERQRQDLDRNLQQQREQYYRNRQPAPQFQRPPLCNSTQVGGQVYTHCY